MPVHHRFGVRSLVFLPWCGRLALMQPVRVSIAAGQNRFPPVDYFYSLFTQGVDCYVIDDPVSHSPNTWPHGVLALQIWKIDLVPSGICRLMSGTRFLLAHVLYFFPYLLQWGGWKR